jgi:Fur family peroxide stress response transcriptional regulator
MNQPKGPEHFRVACRVHGLRVTPQRVAIYEELCRSEEHPAAEQLHAKMRERFPNMSLDTVNRTLLTFAGIGLVEFVEGCGSPRRYDPNLKSHHHVHCVKCGAILDFYTATFDEPEIPREIGQEFTIISRRIVLTGICDRCRRN